MTYARLATGPQHAVAAALSGSAAGISVATSGSTGEPREVLIGADSLRASALATENRLGGPGQWLLAVPTDRIAGAMVLVRSAVAGTTPVTIDSGPFTAEGFARVSGVLDAATRRYVSLVPTQLHRLLASEVGRESLETYDAVLVGGAAMLGGDVPSTVIATYGMTETSGGCVYDGTPLDGVEVDIDEQDRIWLTGPMLADGYADGDTSAWVTRNGSRWLRTNDAGSMADGRLAVWGRLDDVIVTGGLKVHPSAVERELSRLPFVAEAAVVPASDPEWGQRVVAVIAVAMGASLPPLAALREALAMRLEPHQLPREVVAVEHLPRLPHGKIDRRAIQRIIAN